MKKSLIALAALATVGAAQAQSSVTLYGVVDAGYSDIEKTYGTTVQSQKAFTFSNYTTSRWGVRGTEDLGGGLRANFNVESGISSDVMAGYWQTGSAAGTVNAGNAPQATTFGDRALFATLQNNSGTTVGVGFASTAVRDISLKFDPAGGTRLVGSLLTMDSSLSSNRATGVALAQKVGDFTFRAGLSKNDTQAAANNVVVKTNSGFLGGLDYSKGKFEAAYARQETKATSGTTSLTSDAKRTIDIAGASYDLGAAKLFGAYSRIKISDATVALNDVTAFNTTATTFTGTGKRSMYSLGASAPVGKTVLFATYSAGNIEQVLADNTAATKRDMSGYTVGARYNLSKRTFGYAALGQAKIDATTGTTNYVKVEQMTAGLVHNF